jgi:hypothetical protein
MYLFFILYLSYISSLRKNNKTNNKNKNKNQEIHIKLIIKEKQDNEKWKRQVTNK